MLYKSFTHDTSRNEIAGKYYGNGHPRGRGSHDKRIQAAGAAAPKAKAIGGLVLLAILLCGLVCGVPLFSTAQTIPGNDSLRYVHDTRTYGIRYQRSWFDSALTFPILGDTTMGTGQGHPTLFATGYAQTDLWWNNGAGRNFQIGGGNGTVTGAANGNQLDGDSVIMGYSAAVPNLYRSVNIDPGQNHSWGINADSIFFSTGTNNRRGGFLGVGPSDGFGNLWNAQLGFVDSTSGNTQGIEAAGFGYSWFGQFPSGAMNSVDISEDELQTTIFNPNDSGYQFTYENGPGMAPLLSINMEGAEVVTTMLPSQSSTRQQALNFWWANPNPFVSGNMHNLFSADDSVNFHVLRLATDGDLLQGNPEGNEGISIASALNVNPDSIVIRGGAQSLRVSFKVGTLSTVPTLDSTTAIFSITWNNNAAVNNEYITTVSANNSQAAVALANCQPWIKNVASNNFALMSGLVAWNTAVIFKNNTWVTFTFTTIDN
jgi:hypothetical protein